MKLRIFLPTAERPEASTRFPWMLFDERGGLLRQGECALDEVPRGDHAEVLLPASRVLFARLKLPRVSAATIRELLPYAVEDRLLADPSHIHAVAGKTHAAGETLVAVIDREWLRAMLDALAGAGIRPASAWPQGCLLAGGHGDWNLVWGERRGMLVDDDGVSATFDHDGSGALPLALRLALDEAAARGARPQSVRVHTEAGSRLPDLGRWSSDASVAFAPGTQWEVLSRGQPAEGSIDLLQGDFARRRAASSRLPRAAIVLAASIAALQLGLVALDAARLERERSTLEARREAIFRDAFPEAKVVVDPDLQMRRNLAELKRTRGITVRDDFLGRLSAAAQQSPGPARSIEYANGKLTIRRGETPLAKASP
ncbi:MAG: type II secretion system protein GspL [Usitatibacter sp.]